MWLLRYREDTSRVLRVERWTEPRRVAVRGPGRAASNRLEDCDEDGVEDDARPAWRRDGDRRDRPLQMTSFEGIGWAVAIAAAACFAEHGDGLIQADEEGWMAPEGQGVEQILDGD